jgi:hypothetical protein
MFFIKLFAIVLLVFDPVRLLESKLLYCIQNEPFFSISEVILTLNS